MQWKAFHSSHFFPIVTWESIEMGCLEDSVTAAGYSGTQHLVLGTWYWRLGVVTLWQEWALLGVVVGSLECWHLPGTGWLGSTATGGKAQCRCSRVPSFHYLVKTTFHLPGLMDESVEPQGKNWDSFLATLSVTNSKTPNLWPKFN